MYLVRKQQKLFCRTLTLSTCKRELLKQALNEYKLKLSGDSKYNQVNAEIFQICVVLF